ncbi:conserved Plasmodium protein, unknown function [Plasmodium sp. gorilla clade G2]|uniref:conserved Plasmodium protein, unknown function n=1 Tax=Plasmodium sp. gorilla clade G2 TaxID=880535 RepID=UPI000D206444|nr:conserved Plasmodium protein, unknown function [Plasmodium sp. gorilla clade G2]SOV17664.1 conserved Plasmodium protein, unknown function [Plasmodium sp. gorilla clade G2]
MSTLENVKNIVSSVNVICDISSISPNDIVKKEEKDENKNKENYMLTTDTIDSTLENIDNNECGDTTNVESTNEQKNGSYHIIDDKKKTEEGNILEYDHKMKIEYYNNLCNYIDNKKYILINDKENKTTSKISDNDNFMYQNNMNKNITSDGNILKDEYKNIDDIRAEHKQKMLLCNNEFLYKYKIYGKYGKVSKRNIEESSFNDLSKYGLICDVYNKKYSYYKEKKIKNKLNLSKKNLTDSEVENYDIGYNIKKNNGKRYLLSNDFVSNENIEEKKKKKNMNIYQYRNVKENNIIRNIYNNNNNMLNKKRMCYKNIPSFNYINTFNLLDDSSFRISENNFYKKIKKKKKKLENMQSIDIYDNNMDLKIDNEDKLNNNDNILKNEGYIENKKDLGEIKKKSTNLKRNLNTDLISNSNLKKKMKKDSGYSFLHLNIYKNNNTHDFYRNNSYNTYILKTVGNSYLKHKINEKKNKMKSTIINTINSNNTNNIDNISNKQPSDNMDIHMYGSKDNTFYHDNEEKVNDNIEEKDIKQKKNESIETKNYINDKKLSNGTKYVIHKENVFTDINNKIAHDYISNDNISNDNISNDNISNEYIPYEYFTNNEDVNSSNFLNKSESLNSMSSTNSAHINNMMNSSGENDTNCIPTFNDKTVDLLHLNLHDVVRMLENQNIENLYTPEELKEILIPISGVYYSVSDGRWIYHHNNIDDDDNNIDYPNNIDNSNNIDDDGGKELNKMTSSEQTKNKADNEKNIFDNKNYSFHEGRQLALMLKYKNIKRKHNIFKNIYDEEMFFSDINDYANKEIYNDVDDLNGNKYNKYNKYNQYNKYNNEEDKVESQSNKYELQHHEIYNVSYEQINNMNEEEKCNVMEKTNVSQNDENIKRNEQKEILKDEYDKDNEMKKIDDKEETKIIKKIQNNDISLLQNIECDEKIHFCDTKIEENNNSSNNKLKEFHLNETGNILKNEMLSYNAHINTSKNNDDINDCMKKTIYVTKDTCKYDALNNKINNINNNNNKIEYVHINKDINNFNSSDNICSEEKKENMDNSKLLKCHNYDKKYRQIHFKNKKDLYKMLGINYTKDIKNRIKCLEEEHIFYEKEKKKWIIQIVEQKNNTILYLKEFDCKIFGFLYACFLSLEYKQLYLDYFLNEKKQDYLLNLIQTHFIKKRKTNHMIHQLNIHTQKKETNEEEEKNKMIVNTNKLSLNVGRYLYEKDKIINYQKKKMDNIKKNQYIDDNMERNEMVEYVENSQNYYVNTKDGKDNINIYKTINQNFIQNLNGGKTNNENIISIYEQNKSHDYNMHMLKNRKSKQFKDFFDKSKYGSYKNNDNTMIPNICGYNNMISICDKEKDIINKKYEKNNLQEERTEKNILNYNIIQDDKNEKFDHKIDTLLLDYKFHDKNQINNYEQVDKDINNFYIDKNICVDINSSDTPILHDTHIYNMKNEKENNINDIKESDDNFMNLSNFLQNENEITDKTLKKKRNNCSYKKQKNVKDSLAHYKNSNLSIELEEEERNNLIKLNNYVKILNEKKDITSIAKQTILLLLKDILNSIPYQMAPSITSRKIYDRKIHAHVHFVYQSKNIIDLVPYFFIFKNIIKQKTLPSNQSLYICNVLLYALFEA